MKIKLILFIFVLVSCSTTRLGHNQIENEFGSSVFKLDRPMYLTLYFDCGVFGMIQEGDVADVDFVEMISSDDIDYFKSYQSLDIGDAGCSYSEDIRVYKLLEAGQELNIVSIKDVLNASWWFWEIKGNIEINGKSRSFRMELGYEKSKSLRDVLSEVFELPPVSE